MPNSSPAWIRTVEVAVVVAGDITPSELSFDDIIDKLDEIWAEFEASTGADVDAILTNMATYWAAFLAGAATDVANILTELTSIGEKVDDIHTQIATNVVGELQDIEEDIEALKTEVDDNWDEEKELWFPTNKRAAGGVGKYSGTDTTYQTVTSWTVATGWEGELKEILILADDYDHTYIHITVGSVTWCTDWNAQGAMPIIFEDLRLAAGQSVTVQAKSDDGTAIVVDAIIVSKEIS